MSPSHFPAIPVIPVILVTLEILATGVAIATAVVVAVEVVAEAVAEVSEATRIETRNESVVRTKTANSEPGAMLYVFAILESCDLNSLQMSVSSETNVERSMICASTYLKARILTSQPLAEIVQYSRSMAFAPTGGSVASLGRIQRKLNMKMVGRSWS
jgi:hypothetical protein